MVCPIFAYESILHSFLSVYSFFEHRAGLWHPFVCGVSVARRLPAASKPARPISHLTKYESPPVASNPSSNGMMWFAHGGMNGWYLRVVVSGHPCALCRTQPERIPSSEVPRLVHGHWEAVSARKWEVVVAKGDTISSKHWYPTVLGISIGVGSWGAGSLRAAQAWDDLNPSKPKKCLLALYSPHQK